MVAASDATVGRSTGVLASLTVRGRLQNGPGAFPGAFRVVP